MEPILVASIGAVAGLIAGVIGSLIAPWVHWGIEKQRDRRAAQRELLSLARSIVVGDRFGPERFAQTATYSRLKPFLSEYVVSAIENPEEAQDHMDYPGEFLNVLRTSVLEDISRIEKQWEHI